MHLFVIILYPLLDKQDGSFAAHLPQLYFNFRIPDDFLTFGVSAPPSLVFPRGLFTSLPTFLFYVCTWPCNLLLFMGISGVQVVKLC